MLAELNWTDWRSSGTTRQRSFPAGTKYFSTSWGDSRISARAPYSPSAAAAVHWVSMSEPMISMSWTSTSGQFSSSQMAIE